ncbi:ArsC/Spx/MgsR family protein [Methylophaga sp.]|uniref:ArsC/Spx/MgsR family protein n=1 Tax=Methylophaga sp. TaxID=2024840 RepID=UPI002717658A|nr:ArsC/Spx/MgsR family protein [Methylophaga sp.]MDO8828055.1 ArsC/Spx/MgsR family protein [Methylophaga sp.]
MAQIIFYEKPGCINNTKQKKLLREAGHCVIAKNLLTENWSENPLNLMTFLNKLPVSEWFNRSAPAIKQGIINPEALDLHQAINVMLSDPLLIRRPLIQVGNEKRAGFNKQDIEHWIGLNSNRDTSDLENCPKTHNKVAAHG